MVSKNSSIKMVNIFFHSIKIDFNSFKCPLNGQFKCNTSKHLNGQIISNYWKFWQKINIVLNKVNL